MDIKEYRYIWEIYNQGGISKAAEALYISQPSLSLYLKNIEKRLGIDLFITTSGSARPTAAGKIYLEYAQQILGIDERLMDVIEGIKRRQGGVVRIGITATRSTYITPILLARCNEVYPGIDLKIQEYNTNELEDHILKKRDLDIILTNESFNAPELTIRPLYQEQFLLALPKKFVKENLLVLKDGDKIPWIELSDLSQIPFVLLKKGHRLRQIADTLFSDCDMVPEILLETERTSTALSMAEQGLGACFIYDTVFMHDISDSVVICQIGSEPIYRRFVAACTEESLQYPPVQAVLELIIDVVKKEHARLIQNL